MRVRNFAARPSDGCAPKACHRQGRSRGGEPETFGDAAILAQRPQPARRYRHRRPRWYRPPAPPGRHNASTSARIAVQRAFAAECDQCAARALRQQMPRRRHADRWLPVSAAASVSFGAIDVDQRQQRGHHGRAGAGLSTMNHPAACAARIACAFASSGISCCSSRIPGAPAPASARSTNAGVAGGVGARDHHDRIGALRIDGDQRGAGRPLHRLHGIAAHAIAPQPGNQIASELIVADAARHRDARAEPRRRNRLVGPLAAGRGEEVRAEHRLPGARQMLASRNKVHVQAADHQDRLGRSASILLSILSSRRREHRMRAIWRRLRTMTSIIAATRSGLRGRRHR